MPYQRASCCCRCSGRKRHKILLQTFTSFSGEGNKKVVMSEALPYEGKTWGELMCIKGRYISIRELFVVFTLLPNRLQTPEFSFNNFGFCRTLNSYFLCFRTHKFGIYLFWMMLLPRTKALGTHSLWLKLGESWGASMKCYSFSKTKSFYYFFIKWDK